MRKLFTYITAILLTAGLSAQSPERISYQAVVRDVENNLVRNKTVGMQISILQESPEGTAVYVETQTPATNDNGLVSIEIGGGTVVSGNFSEIVWENGPYFIKTETDPEGGTDYSISGTSQLLSVPYALYAREAGNVPDVSGINTNTQAIQDTAAQLRADIPDVTGITTNTQAIQDTAAQIRADIPNISESDPSVPVGTKPGQMQYWDGTQWITIEAGKQGQVLTIVNGLPAWGTQSEVWGDVTNPVTGKTWMDRNLGALRVATSSSDAYAYGDLYQWGRSADGHQSRTSTTTVALSSSDIPGHHSFITPDSSPNDWRSPQNNNLWQGENGINNPCPSGYRLPIQTEWEAEIQSWSSQNIAGAFDSPLKFPAAGIRQYNGMVVSSDTLGYYWISTIFNNSAISMGLLNGIATYFGVVRATGASIRCIKDYTPATETVTNPVTGKTWMDRNLGASQVATSSTDADAYGDLYQWGRAADGHQIRGSGTTFSLSSSDTVGHDLFIITNLYPNDWRSPQNDNLWQGVSGTNNPCPDGFRLPTDTEWDAERLSWSSNDATGAFASPLKLPLAGFRHTVTGNLDVVGAHGYYWSSTGASTNSRGLSFNNGAIMSTYQRGHGFPVRCIED